jgi:hypothetical protein
MTSKSRKWLLYVYNDCDAMSEIGDADTNSIIIKKHLFHQTGGKRNAVSLSLSCIRI